VVREAWSHCLPQDAVLSLFAVGGYGRGELFPQSDIDLLVLGEADAQAGHADALARFFTLLWDAGLPVGMPCVPPRSARAPRTKTSPCLRPAGSAELAADLDAASQLAAAVSPQLIWPPAITTPPSAKSSARAMPGSATPRQPRPNLKEGPGGLARRADIPLDGAAHHRHLGSRFADGDRPAGRR
jgi:[protein-PII] uridylyltransferase